jgi:hypothetical protein
MCTYIIEKASFRSNIGARRGNSGICDICHTPRCCRLSDGPTRSGIWAWMCPTCLKEVGRYAATTMVREDCHD